MGTSARSPGSSYAAGDRLPEEKAHLLTVVRTDGDTGIIKVLRTIGWKQDFAAAMHHLCSRLVDEQASPERATAERNQMFALPTAQLVGQATARG